MPGIVVGVDGSEDAARALVWAAKEAPLHDWPLTAVLAWGWLAQYHAIGGETFDPAYVESDAVAALDAYVADALGPRPTVAVHQRVVNDLAPRALLEASADASLLVVGARGLGGFRGLLLGSVSQQCLHHAPCSMAVVRGDDVTPNEGSGRIVVGIDGSETAGRALAWAAEEASLRRASLEVVHAWQPPCVGGYPLVGVTVDPSLFEEAARSTLDAAVVGIDGSRMAQPVQRTLVNGGAASSLLHVAKGADLVVVGSRGLGEVTGPLLGSVSHRVVHHAACPVVVVPSGS